MRCSSCGLIGDESLFTTGNRSHNGTVGRCKACRSKVNAKYRAKEVQMTPAELIPDMIERRDARIGVLRLNKIANRMNNTNHHIITQNQGLEAVLSELDQDYEYCYAENINDYDSVLVSLMSPMDVENLVYTFERYAPKQVNAKVIVGGFGVLNINLIRPYVDVAVFGRAEGQINSIIKGVPQSNTWIKANDEGFTRQYLIRQPQYLVKGEVGVGCRNKCRYCLYTHVRRQITTGKYNPGENMPVEETDWHGLSFGKTRYVTAFDGFSERTRYRVGKAISDQHITDKLIQIGNTGTPQTTMKIYQIVGYPWETLESVMDDIEKSKAIYKTVDKNITGRINIGFLCNPFGPEPFTPMWHEPANIYVNWFKHLSGLKIHYGEKVKVYVITSITGQLSLLKRVMINRASETDQALFKNISFNTKIKNMADEARVAWLIKNRIVDPDLFGEIGSPPVPNLSIDNHKNPKQLEMFDGEGGFHLISP